MNCAPQWDARCNYLRGLVGLVIRDMLTLSHRDPWELWPYSPS